MANAHGGFRPGAGRVPRDLHEVIDYRETRDPETGAVTGRIPVSIMDRIEEAIRTGGFLHDAAARVGVTVETLREWRRLGVKAHADVLAGRKRRSGLTKRQVQYAELAFRMERAEAEARLQLLGLGQRLAMGGIPQLETVERTVRPSAGNPQVVEVTERKSTTLPDPKMITWLLAHRWPDDFAGRVELSGPQGGPIQHDTTPALDKLRALIDQTSQNTGTNGHQTPQPTPNGHN